MGQDTSEIFKGKNFKWAHIFSGFNAAKTKEEKQRQLMAGLPGNVPYESDMIKEWQPPFLFYKFFLYCFVMMALIFVCSYLYGFGDALIVSVIPYMIPLLLLIMIWELNIPRNLSILDVLYIAAFSGILCYLVIFFINDITGIAYMDSFVFTSPLLAEIAQLLLICIFLRKKSRGYGLNGLLVGAAVGAGYAMMTTADDLFYIAEYAGQIEGIMGLILVRIFTVIGGNILWMAAVGGALALAKGKEALKGRHLGNSLFLICLIGTYLLAVLWNYDIGSFFARFADSDVMNGLYTFLDVYQGRYILLTVVAWALFLFIARKGVEQAIDIAQQAKADQRKWESKIANNYAGKAEIYGVSGAFGGQKFVCTSKSIVFGRDASCTVKYAGDTKGISSVHCEIKKQGDDYVLIDKNSSYGTFWKNGEKLEAGKPYILSDHAEFYLASPENAYQVSVRKEGSAGLPVEMRYGKRTNEIDGAEESGQNVYIACGIVLAVMFLAFYIVSDQTGALFADDSYLSEENGTFQGAWVSDTTYDIKDIILSRIDNVITIADIGLFKEKWANGITFTQDGMAYCTYNGTAIDYARFSYSIVDDSTLHLQWSYGADIDVGVKLANVGITVGDETGFDVSYVLDGDVMYLSYAGYNLTLHR